MGMTVLPDDIDATGERIEGTAQIVDTRHVAFANKTKTTQLKLMTLSLKIKTTCQKKSVIQSLKSVLLTPLKRSTRLHMTLVLKHSSKSILRLPRDTPEAFTVQYLVAQVFDGNMTAEAAFNDGIGSGQGTDKLVSVLRTGESL